MSPGEPDLFHELPGLGSIGPQGRLERRTMLVDGQRMVGALHNPAQLGVVELVLAPAQPPQPPQRDAESANRVPHADELHRDALGTDGVRAPEAARGVGFRALDAAAIERHGVTVLADRCALEDAAFPDHADQAACGIRPTTEAEHEQLVAILVVADQKPVRIEHVVLEPVAERATRKPVEHVARAHALAVVHDLRHAIGRALGDAEGKLHHVGGTRLAVALLIGAVPRAVAAQNEAFHLRRILPHAPDACQTVACAHTLRARHCRAGSSPYKTWTRAERLPPLLESDCRKRQRETRVNSFAASARTLPAAHRSCRRLRQSLPDPSLSTVVDRMPALCL
jgi:hypothetical protein